MPAAFTPAGLACLLALLGVASLRLVESRAPPPWAWSRIDVKGSRPSVREGHAVVEVGTRAYIFGGCMQEVRCYNDVWILDTDRMDFHQEPLSGYWPQPRGGHSATRVGTNIFIYGGANAKDTFADVYRLDIVKQHWTTSSTPPDDVRTPGRRTNHAAVADADGRIYIFGGSDIQGKFLNDMWVLNTNVPLGEMWQAHDLFYASWSEPAVTGVVPAARVGHTMTLISRGLFVFGGYDVKGRMLNDLHMYDLDARDWRELRPLGSLPPPRQGHTAVRHGRELILAGGCDISPELPRCFGDAWSLDLLDMKWTERSTDWHTWLPREGHSATFVRGRMVMFGGCMLGAECYNDVVALDTFDPCPNHCSGNGQCLMQAGGSFCRCTHPGFGGHDCLQPISCREDCGPHGQCADDGRCECENGWSGERCSREAMCPGHASKCSGHGVCLESGHCHCLPGFAGKDCAASAAFLQQQEKSTGLWEGHVSFGLDSLYSDLMSHLRSIQPHAASPSAAVPVTDAKPRSGVLNATSVVNVPGVAPLGAGGSKVAAPLGSAKGLATLARRDDTACPDNCNSKGVCEGGVCWCNPGYYGDACESFQVQAGSAVTMQEIILITGGGLGLGAILMAIGLRLSGAFKSS